MTTLREAAQRRLRLLAELEEARVELAEIIKREFASGSWRQSQLAKETGYTREHIRRIVNEGAQ